MKRLIAFLLAAVLIAGLAGCGKQQENNADEEESEMNADQTDAEPKTAVDLILEKTGGKIYGVCHPNENYMRIKDVGLGWVRFDIPYPYEADGRTIRSEYTQFKNRAGEYTKNKFKVMAITPYPRDFLDIGGYDPGDSANAARVREIVVFLINDLRDVIAGIQISNELNHTGHIRPFTTLQQSADFIGLQAKALYDVRGDIIVGYNSAGYSESWTNLMKPYLKYMDYVALDLYYGTYDNGTLQNYVNDINKLYRLVNKPILMAEFGYASKGSPTAEDRAAKLARYGYASEAEARADIVNLVEQLPNTFKTLIKTNYPNTADWANAVFVTYANHFYGYNKRIPADSWIDVDLAEENITHDEEGQANYFRQLIPLLMEQKCLIGFFIYCWKDRTWCLTCGYDDCPNETSWGLVDDSGNRKKPSYYAVKEAIAACKEQDAAK